MWIKTVWRVTMVDAGDFKVYTKELTVDGQSGEMLLALNTQCNEMAPNSIYSLKVEYLRTVG